jgi:hypothetical protein
VVARGYTTVQRVVDRVGSELTAAQVALIPDLIEEAEALFDREAGRVWLVASPATERHPAYGALVYLRRYPVLTVTSVTARHPSVGSEIQTLVAAESYELLDADHGVLRLSNGYHGYDLTIAYTHANPSALPADVRHHATELVAHWMTRRLAGGAGAVKSASVDDVTVTFAEGSASDAEIPEGVGAFLRSMRGLVFA